VKGIEVPELIVENISEFVGREVGLSVWSTVDEAIIDWFAECGGDKPERCEFYAGERIRAALPTHWKSSDRDRVLKRGERPWM
jgi:hypothetical protein